jgi:hypothetical protein
LTPPNPPKRPPSLSDGDRPSVELEAVVGAAKDYAVFQDHIRPELARKSTLTGLPAARQPERKQTFTGLGATKPPPLPWNKTVRAPSPPPLVAASRRTDPPVSFGPPPMGIRVPPDEKPSVGPPSVAPEIAARLAKLAEYERRERVQIESRGPGPYQPPLRSQSPVPSSGAVSKPPDRGDWAKLKYKVATATVAALVLVIAALGYWAVTAINAKTEAIKAAQEQKKKSESREAEWRQWASVVIWIEDCRDGRDVRSGEMLLPDPQKMGTARKLEPWQNPCSPKLPPPP